MSADDIQRQIEEEMEREVAKAMGTPRPSQHTDPLDQLFGGGAAAGSHNNNDDADHTHDNQHSDATTTHAEVEDVSMEEELLRQEEAATQAKLREAALAAEAEARAQAEEGKRQADAAAAAALREEQAAAKKRAEEEAEAKQKAAAQKAKDEAEAVQRAIEAEVARRLAEAQEAARQAEALRKQEEAEAALRHAQEQQAKIEAAVAERLLKAKEEAEAKKKAEAEEAARKQKEADAEAEIERRVQEALQAKLAKQAEEARKAHDEAEAQRRMEEEIERRVAAATQARLDALSSPPSQAPVANPATRTPGSTTSNSNKAKKEEKGFSIDEDDDDKDLTGSSSSGSEGAREAGSKRADSPSLSLDSDDDRSAGSDNDEEDHSSSVKSATPHVHLNPLPASELSNGNGLLSRDDPSAARFQLPFESTGVEYDFDLFESSCATEAKGRGVPAEQLFPKRLQVQTFDTVRETGRCLAPEGEVADPATHMSIQLGFFRSQQKLVSYVGNGKPAIADRSASLSENQKKLSEKRFFHESDVLKDQTVTEYDDECEHNAPSERLLPGDSGNVWLKDPQGAVRYATSAYSVGDPLQVWERTRGRRAEAQPSTMKPINASFGGAGTQQGPTTTTVTSGPFTGRIWVNDLETRKPVAAVPVFTGGLLLRFQLQKITSQVEALHGPGTDPLFFSAAIYCVNSTQHIVVSETFRFGNDLETFFPHRQTGAATQNFQDFTAFVPQEFKGVPLFLGLRAYRLASEDFADFADLYTRPASYKAHHVVPMKQETQQLAMISEVLEELGFYVFSLYDDGKIVQGPLNTDKVYRIARPITDAEMMKLMMDTRGRANLRTIQIGVELNVTDVTSHEATFVNRSSNIQNPAESEALLELFNPDVQNAQRQPSRYVPCSLPILNAGFFNGYHNVMYVRFQAVRLINVALVKYATSTYKSFVLQIALKDNDADLSEEGLKAVYAGVLGDGLLATSAFTTSVHHAREFDMGDEVKFQLPLVLSPKLHLFITVWAVSFKRQAGKDPRLVKMGHIAVPLITSDGGLFVKDSMEAPLVGVDHCNAMGNGYLAKFPEAPGAACANLGTWALRFGVHVRSSVHASNVTVSQLFKGLPASLSALVKDNGVLSNDRSILAAADANADQSAHTHCLAKINELPLAEIMAFYPLTTAYCLSLIASPSTGVSFPTRVAAFNALTELTHKAQSYDFSAKSLVNRRAGSAPRNGPVPPNQTGVVRTCVVNVMYHHVTNDLLYQPTLSPKGGFKLFAALVEVWPAALEEAVTAAASFRASAQQVPMLNKITDLLWFYLDLTLRSLYLYTAQNPGSRSKSDSVFFAKTEHLVGMLLDKVVSLSGVVAVQRIAVFVRNLSLCCDRGHCLKLFQAVIRRLEGQGISVNAQLALRIFLDADDTLLMLFPSRAFVTPQFLTLLTLKTLKPHLTHASRDLRASAGTILYNTLVRLVNSRFVANQDLALLATQLMDLVGYCSENWLLIRQNWEKSGVSPAFVLLDKRTLLAVLFWVLFQAPESYVRDWTKSLEHKTLAGFLAMLTDGQSAFRYSTGKDKIDAISAASPSTPLVVTAEAVSWDSRMSTLVSFIGCRVISNLLADVSDSALRAVGQDKPNPAVFPFFLALESVLNMWNSTASLQASTALLAQCVQTLFAEIISRKARMASGMVLLSVRMLSSCCLHVRGAAMEVLRAICEYYYDLTGSLSKLRNNVANALVAVAESKVRDLRLVGAFVEEQVKTLRNSFAENHPTSALVVSDAIARFANESVESSGDAGVKYNYVVRPLFLSCNRALRFPAYLLNNAHATDRPSLAADFANMSVSMMSLFQDVLRLQVDDTMKFKESRSFAYQQVVFNFLKQNTLKEVFKWLGRLHESHKSAGDHAEAAMVLVFHAALGFRITEAFYAVKGDSSRGARMPVEILTHVLWHDYVRVLPELDQVVTLDAIYTMVNDMSTVPDDASFTMEGQIKLMKEAAEFLDKGQYYEWSLMAVAVVEKMVSAKSDMRAAGVVHGAMATWANAIAAPTAKRVANRYFLLWARMEREPTVELPKKKKRRHHSDDSATNSEDEEGKDPQPQRKLTLDKPIKRIFKFAPNTDERAFADYAHRYIASLIADPSLLHFTVEMTPTAPAPLASAASVLGSTITGSSSSKKSSKKAKAAPPPPNRCLVTAVEVIPVASEEQARWVSPTGSPLDRQIPVHRFEHVNRVGADRPAASSTPRPQQQSEPDILLQRLSINVHTTERSFPSTTTAIDVASSEEQLLDAAQTALETMEAEIAALQEVPSKSGVLLNAMATALTPMGFRGMGRYYRAVVDHMSGKQEVMSCVREFLNLCRRKLEPIEAELDPRHADVYAQIVKALADIECTMIDIPLELPAAASA